MFNLLLNNQKPKKKEKEKSIYLGEAGKASRSLFEKLLNVKKHLIWSETLQISIRMQQLVKVALQIITWEI